MAGASPIGSSGKSSGYVTAWQQARQARYPAPVTDRPSVPPFEDWLPKVTPQFTWDWPYLEFIQGRLERVTRGVSKRIMLFIPPRHGKSEMTTIRYPVYRLERDPTFRVAVGCYNQTFAERFGRRARKIARERVTLSAERAAAKEWETAEGGVFRSCGVGNPPTGEGFDLIVIDDPVKSRAEAESPAYRDRVYEWYSDDLYTRREPDCAIILIMTRWHEADLAGRLLLDMQAGGDQWDVIRLPALAETQADRDAWAEQYGLPLGQPEPVGREPGEALCPARYPVSELQATRTQQGSYGFTALYQQSPSAREGGLFKRASFVLVDQVPAVAQRVRYWDKAATEGDGDYTVGVLMAATVDGLFWVEDVVRGQWGPGKRDQVIKQTAELDQLTYRGQCRQWFEQEGGSGGKDSAATSVRMLAGMPARAERATGSKEVRADPFAAQVEAGNVRVKKGPWARDYINELCAFPNAAHDDQVDASSGAFSKLASVGRSEVQTTTKPSMTGGLAW